MQKIKDFIYYNRRDILIVLIILFIFVFYIFLSNDNTSDLNEDVIIKENNDIDKDNNISEDSQNKKIVVDIKGEVKNPSTYEVQADERVVDIITKAGGLTENADVNNINLSEKVYDEMVIIVPSKLSIDSEAKNFNSELLKEKVEKKDSKISINSASFDELITISGIGKNKAKNIIDYRNKNGKFKSIEDIKNVSGIGDAIFDKIKNYIKI